MDVGFIVLCPERNLGGLKNTLGSIRHHANERDMLCVVGNDVTATELKEMKQWCDTHKGDNTVTSLINLGLKKLENDWGFILFSGSRIQRYTERRLARWVKNDTDVIFSVVDRKWGFVDGSFNGVLINRNFFKEVGDFPAGTSEAGWNDFELAKLLWAANALEKGVQFKAIVGLKII